MLNIIINIITSVNLYFFCRWEEDSKPDGVKWRTLVHKGPVFAPDYVPLPQTVHFKYSGEVKF